MFTQCVKIKDNVKVKQNLDTMCEDKRYSKKKKQQNLSTMYNDKGYSQ